MKLARSACFMAHRTVGVHMEPHYKRPAAPVPVDVGGECRAGRQTPLGAPDIGWRQFFPDPTLQRLIALALANNRDLRVAVLNVQAAQAQYRIQRADLFPTMPASGVEQIEKYPAGVIAPARADQQARAAGPTARRPDHPVLSGRALDLPPMSSICSARSAA